MFQTLLINRFQKAAPQLIVDLKAGPNDSVSLVFQDQVGHDVIPLLFATIRADSRFLNRGEGRHSKSRFVHPCCSEEPFFF